MELIKLIEEKKLAKKRAYEQVKEKAAKANSEKRSMTGEELTVWNKAMDEIRDLTAEIEKYEQMLEVERSLAGSNENNSGNPAQRQSNEQGMTRANYLASEEYRGMFFDCIAGKRSVYDVISEVRASTGLNVSIDTDKGAVLAPPVFEKNIVDTYVLDVVMRQLATVTTTSALTKIPFSTERAKAFWRGEESAYQATSAKWGTKDIDAHKLTALILISEELLNDSSIANVEAELRTQFSDAFAESEEEAFITGDGVDKPRGFMLDAENGLTTASSTAITPIEIINMYHSLAPKYRKNGTWMFNDDFARILRTMQYADGRFVWQDGLIAGQPDMILKRPVAISEGMADFAAGAKPLAFGDFKRYRIADRTGMYFQRLVELYAGTGQIGLRAYRRMDGKLLVPEAIKTLTVKS